MACSCEVSSGTFLGPGFRTCTKIVLVDKHLFSLQAQLLMRPNVLFVPRVSAAQWSPGAIDQAFHMLLTCLSFCKLKLTSEHPSTGHRAGRKQALLSGLGEMSYPI